MPRAQLCQEQSLGFPHPMGRSGSGLAWAAGDASSPGSPLLWPGGPCKPTASTAPWWERGSSYPGPAAAAPFLFIYIPEKEPAATAASSGLSSRN